MAIKPASPVKHTERTKTVMMRSFPADLWTRARIAAMEQGVTVGELVAQALAKLLRKVA